MLATLDIRPDAKRVIFALPSAVDHDVEAQRARRIGLRYADQARACRGIDRHEQAVALILATGGAGRIFLFGDDAADGQLPLLSTGPGKADFTPLSRVPRVAFSGEPKASPLQRWVRRRSCPWPDCRITRICTTP